MESQTDFKYFNICKCKNKLKDNLLQLGSSNWEAADLGNEERKQKFLRLMGAGKVSTICLCFYLFKNNTVLFGLSEEDGALQVTFSSWFIFGFGK